MKNDKTLQYILGALAIAGFLWAFFERSEKLKITQRLDDKEKDHLRLLNEYLKTKTTLPQEIQEQIIHLRENYKELNLAVAKKMQQVIELLHDSKDEIAIEKLTCIIEHLLKEKYVIEGFAKDKKSCPKLYYLLKKAWELKWINKHQFSFSVFLKDKRNEEAHEIDASFGDNEKYIALLAGIEIVFVLSPKKIKEIAVQ